MRRSYFQGPWVYKVDIVVVGKGAMDKPRLTCEKLRGLEVSFATCRRSLKVLGTLFIFIQSLSHSLIDE